MASKPAESANLAVLLGLPREKICELVDGPDRQLAALFLDGLHRDEVLDVENTHGMSFAVHDRNLVDPPFTNQPDRVLNQRIGIEVAGVGGHHFGDWPCEPFSAIGVDQSAQIPIGEDPAQTPRGVNEEDRARSTTAACGRKSLFDRERVGCDGDVLAYLEP